MPLSSLNQSLRVPANPLSPSVDWLVGPAVPGRSIRVLSLSIGSTTCPATIQWYSARPTPEGPPALTAMTNPIILADWDPTWPGYRPLILNQGAAGTFKFAAYDWPYPLLVTRPGEGLLLRLLTTGVILDLNVTYDDRVWGGEQPPFEPTTPENYLQHAPVPQG